MSRPRLELALTHLRPAQWERFEQFASEFLSSDFPSLRTVASPSGDDGRDAELFSPSGDPSVVLQYSVTDDWSSKISATAQRIREKIPSAAVLIYATNQKVGAAGDSIKKKVRSEFRLHVDILDREWFLDREASSLKTQIAAESLAEDIADPLLQPSQSLAGKALSLTSAEMKAAFVYIKFQWEDDSREKGLTKLCFEALVRSVLRETSSEKRISRREVRSRVRQLLPSHPERQVDQYTDSALNRLAKRAVRFWPKEDEFCLSHQEQLRLKERLAKLEQADKELEDEIGQTITKSFGGFKPKPKVNSAELADLIVRTRRILEKFLLDRGEAFASLIHGGKRFSLFPEDIEHYISRDLGEHPSHVRPRGWLISSLSTTLRALLNSPSEAAQRFLRSISDSYTLMAFLRETPDVQSAIRKMFSHGALWLDTNIILPLFAEELVEDHSRRRFGNLLSASHQLGIQLRVTSGVIEEVERHLNICITFVRSHTLWEGSVPFLVGIYAEAGYSLNSFVSWAERFRGNAQPERDIEEYLDEFFHIKTENMDVSTASQELRSSVYEIFYLAREKRVYSIDLDPISLQRLVSHDVENYLGVILRRREERNSPFGYSAWWLTFHKTAFSAEDELKRIFGKEAPASPVISPDFLVNYLAFGPRRGGLTKNAESMLPLSFDFGAVELPVELINLAEGIRNEMQGLPEHVIRRRIRDTLNSARIKKGDLVEGGIAGVEREILDALREQLPPNE